MKNPPLLDMAVLSRSISACKWTVVPQHDTS